MPAIVVAVLCARAECADAFVFQVDAGAIRLLGDGKPHGAGHCSPEPDPSGPRNAAVRGEFGNGAPRGLFIVGAFAHEPTQPRFGRDAGLRPVDYQVWRSPPR